MEFDSAEYWKKRYEDLLDSLKTDAVGIIEGGKERFDQLGNKNYDLRSFLNGWIEGRSIFAYKLYQKEILISIMHEDENNNLHNLPPPEK